MYIAGPLLQLLLTRVWEAPPVQHAFLQEQHIAGFSVCSQMRINAAVCESLEGNRTLTAENNRKKARGCSQLTTENTFPQPLNQRQAKECRGNNLLTPLFTNSHTSLGGITASCTVHPEVFYWGELRLWAGIMFCCGRNSGNIVFLKSFRKQAVDISKGLLDYT